MTGICFEDVLPCSLRSSGNLSTSGIVFAVLVMAFLQQHSHARYKRGEDDFRTNPSFRYSVHSFVILAPLAVGLEAARRQMRLHDHRRSLIRRRVCNFLSKKTADLAWADDFVA